MRVKNQSYCAYSCSSACCTAIKSVEAVEVTARFGYFCVDLFGILWMDAWSDRGGLIAREQRLMHQD